MIVESLSRLKTVNENRFSPDVVDFAHNSFIIEGITLLLECSDSDLARLVHQVHAEQFARSRRFVPGLYVSFAGNSGFDGPLVLVGRDAGDGGDRGSGVG